MFFHLFSALNLIKFRNKFYLLFELVPFLQLKWFNVYYRFCSEQPKFSIIYKSFLNKNENRARCNLQLINIENKHFLVQKWKPFSSVHHPHNNHLISCKNTLGTRICQNKMITELWAMLDFELDKNAYHHLDLLDLGKWEMS